MSRLTRPLLVSSVACFALGAGSLAQAEDIVLPDFTPASMDDFAAADDLGNLARMAFEDRGLTVLAGPELSDLVGDSSDACAEELACPVSLWGRVDAQTAVVGRVGNQDGLLKIRVLVYEHQGSRATRTYDELLSPASAGELLLRIADDLAPAQAAPPEVTRLDDGIVEEHYAPIGAPLGDPAPGRGSSDRGSSEQGSSDWNVADTRQRTADDHLYDDLDDDGSDSRNDSSTTDVDPIIDRLRLPAYALRRFEADGLDAETWLEEKRVRRPGMFIELHGGAVFGDLDRRYDTRVGLYDELGDAWGDRDLYTYHSFLNGSGFTGGGAVGFQAAWWIDLSILGGVQLGRKELTTGWETWEANGNQSDGSDLLLDSDSTTYAPVSAVLAFMEPRLRLYPVALGPIKPYALAGLNLRFYDAYSVPDDANVDYPEAPGGVGIGPTVGGGLALDAAKGARVFIEVPWTYVVSPAGSTVSDYGGLQTQPVQFTGVGQYLAFKAGLGMLFD